MKRENCSLESAGCSMVVAVTQDSVNATLKEYLDNFDGEFTNQAYCVDVDETGSVVYESMDYEEVKKAVGMDLYTIPKEKEKWTKEQEAALHKAYEELGFTLGFRFRIGLPEAKDPSSLRDIVTFLESDSSSIANVHYTMYLKEFEIIKIAVVPRKGYVFTNLKQDPDKPWYFTSRVKLDMKGEKFAELPEEIQDKLKPKDIQGHLSMDQILSIQQLYMDLNTAKLTDDFELEGFDKSDEIYHLFQSGFLNNYVEECRKKGGIILGYLAKQFEPSGKREFIKLEDFNFCITPYYKEDDGTDKEKQGLYSLNYLFSSPGQKMGDLKKYANAVRWNWVETSEKGSIHGRMAVDREGLLEQFAKHFRTTLECVQLTPHAEASVNLVKASYKVWMTPDDSQAVFQYGQNKYTYSYAQKAEAHDSYLNTVDVKINYHVDSEMTFQGTRINFQTKISCDANLNVDGGTAKGTLYNMALSYGIRLAVNQEGKLRIEPDEKVTETEGSTRVSSDAWLDFLTFGTGKSSLLELKKYIIERVNSYKDNAVLQAKGAFSDMNYWIFPGGKVFTFKTPEISKEGNVMVGITYAEPN